mgnify:CR=1 FL=1
MITYNINKKICLSFCKFWWVRWNNISGHNMSSVNTFDLSPIPVVPRGCAILWAMPLETTGNESAAALSELHDPATKMKICRKYVIPAREVE